MGGRAPSQGPGVKLGGAAPTRGLESSCGRFQGSGASKPTVNHRSRGAARTLGVMGKAPPGCLEGWGLWVLPPPSRWQAAREGWVGGACAPGPSPARTVPLHVTVEGARVQDPSVPARESSRHGMKNRAVCILHVNLSLRKHMSAPELGLEQVVEVVQALAQLPDGHPDTQLPGQRQPHLQGLQAEGASASTSRHHHRPRHAPRPEPLVPALTPTAHRSLAEGKGRRGKGHACCPQARRHSQSTRTFRVG